MSESRTTRVLTLALAILLAAGAMAGLLGGLTPTGGVVREYPDAAEIPTDGRLVEALGPAPLGAVGAALQLVVVLACPAICLAMGFLHRSEGRGRPADLNIERRPG